ncbi:hypothetical protein GWI33_014138 [Rhynchophorus ferrugineus]|uniref:Uncharacterized protein n=1 Tax=Rhynchophorus ferrugineus TaxID=354439 RepID=A0A834I395_RHYFE|nr:hypothetical protein GWI33_014138 [Rhynchophorus ferrugineus]
MAGRNNKFPLEKYENNRNLFFPNFVHLSIQLSSRRGVVKKIENCNRPNPSGNCRRILANCSRSASGRARSIGPASFFPSSLSSQLPLPLSQSWPDAEWFAVLSRKSKN